MNPGVSCPLPLAFSVPPGMESIRLDAALGLALPGMGLRARRRLWEHCRISVNGRAREPGFAVSGGDSILVEPAARGWPPSSFPPPSQGLFPHAPPFEPVASGPDYLAFDKPCGLHSAHVAGSPEPSLEALLDGSAQLLTRLDKGTSGLVLAARSQEAADRFRALEARGAVEKRYLAVLRGTLEGPLTLTGRLCTANTAVTRVLDESDPDPVRHTTVRPLRSPCGRPAPGGIPLTLAEVLIHRGARHQIRAHLAHAGYPLLGENRYAPVMPDLAPDCFFLHHAEVAFPGFHAACRPPWESSLLL